jgi:hypothetical protein
MWPSTLDAWALVWAFYDACGLPRFVVMPPDPETGEIRLSIVDE